MGKVREFWIQSNIVLLEGPTEAPLRGYHVREIAEIPWDKIWGYFETRNWSQPQIWQQTIIVQLVEAALRGELEEKK